MPRVPRYLVCALLTALVPWASPGIIAQQGAKGGEWRSYAGDTGSSRYAPYDQINRDNVKDLQVAWSWKFDNFGGGSSETTPIMANGVLYFTVGQRRNVIAVNPGTGETLWTWRTDEGERFEKAPRKVGRGVAYWTDGTNARIITVTPGFQLFALDAKTGVPIRDFGNGGSVDLFKQLDLTTPLDPIGRIGNSSAPVVSNGVIVVGPALTQGGTAPSRENVKGDVMAFDVRTGKKLWVFHTIPRFGEPGYETWLNESAEYTGNTGVWGPFSADDELGYVYLATESPTNDGYGGHRPGNNLYSDSEVCLDIKTGKTIWFKQLIHHDIWDYDMPVHPILIDLKVNGRPIKAVVQMGKMALAYVLDRTNGQPVFPIPDVPVAQTDVPTEWTAATQPIPTRPPAFDVVGIKTDDLINFTPALREEALQAIKGYRLGGPFAPPSLVVPDVNRGTIVAPGFGGGANWPSGASDPETGFVYVGSLTRPFVAGVVKTDPPDPTKAAYTAGRGGQVPNVRDLPLLKPPYGRITAYDMNKGEIAWQVPNGDTPPAIKEAFAKLGLTNVPPTGFPAQASFVVTKTLLVGGEGGGGRPILHAYDKKTGDNIVELPMPGSQTAVPMTYMYQNRQFIVVAVGGQPAGQLVAFALPVPGGTGGGRGGRGGGGGAPAPAPGGARGAAPAGQAALPPDINPVTLSRMPPVTKSDLDPESQKLLEARTNVTPGPGPGHLGIYNPKAAEGTGILGRALGVPTGETSRLGTRMYQLVVLITAREIDQQYEWSAHEPMGLRAGLEPSVIDVVKYDRDVNGLAEKDATVIQFLRALLREHKVSPDLWARTIQTFGRQNTVEIMQLMGDYFTVGTMMNAADQHLPPTRQPLLPPLKR